MEVEEAPALFGEGQARGGELRAAASLCWDHVGLCTAELGHQDGLLGHRDLGTTTARAQTEAGQARGAEVGEWCVPGAGLQPLRGGGWLGVTPGPPRGSLSPAVPSRAVSRATLEKDAAERACHRLGSSCVQSNKLIKPIK